MELQEPQQNSLSLTSSLLTTTPSKDDNQPSEPPTSPTSASPSASASPRQPQKEEREEEETHSLFKPLTEEAITLLAYIEQYYNTNGIFPPVQELVRSPLSSDYRTYLQELIENNVFDQLGIPVEESKLLSPIQIAAIDAVTSYDQLATVDSRLKTLGITRTQWANWLADANFTNYLTQVAATRFNSARNEVDDALLKAVKKGSVQAMRLYYQVTGVLDKDVSTANTTAIVTALLEIIQRNISDPTVLRVIASQFEAAMLNPNPPVQKALSPPAPTRKGSIL